MNTFLLKKSVVFAIYSILLVHGIGAQIIRNVPNDSLYFPPDIAVDSLSENECLYFTDLRYFPYAGYYDSNAFRVPYYVRKNDWNYPEEPYYRDSIIYWDTSVIACFETADFEQRHDDIYQIPSHIGMYGKRFDVHYYFVNITPEDAFNYMFQIAPYFDEKSHRPYQKYEIPNSLEQVFRYRWTGVTYEHERGERIFILNGNNYPCVCFYYGSGFLPFSCDTLIVGTSIKNLLPSAFSRSKYLFLKAGIHPSRARLNEYVDNKMDFPTVNFRDFYGYVSSVDSARSHHVYGGYHDRVNKGMICTYTQEQVHFEWKEIHVPKGFKEYYQTGVDSLDNILIDDLPVVQCTCIQLLRKRFVPLVNDKKYFIHYYFEDVSDQHISIEDKDSLYIQVLCEPVDATVRYFAKLSSSDESVATIDSLGMIRARSEGRTIITAEALDGSGVTAHLTIDVVPATGVSAPSVASTRPPQGIYSLMGLRQSLPPRQLRRGVYIVDGKKVLVK